MRRVLLVNPPFYRLMGSHYNGLPLGVAYVTAVLNHAGHDAWLYNADFAAQGNYRTVHDLYEASRQMHALVGPDSPFVYECADAILAFKPDVVGYTCYTATIPIVASVSRRVRESRPDVLQVIGGPHVSLDSNVLSHLPDIHYAVPGEGEVAMRALVQVGPEGWGFFAAKRIGHVSDLPFPERRKFWGPSGPLTSAEQTLCNVSSIVTARGCPWRCRYCASQFIWPKVIARSIDSVVREVAYVAAIRPGCEIHFVDDTFTYNEERALSIMRGIAALGTPIPWRCEARADTITPAVAKAMAESGCQIVKIGIESGSDRILRAMRKGETTEAMRTAVALLQGRGIAVTAYLMAGYPGETDDDLRQTIQLARELKADAYSISLVTPYYGTPLYADAVAQGQPLPGMPWESFFHQSAAMMLNRNLSPTLLEELWALNGKQKT
jgi:anaerobic magnesium-protoporphyrin IX monomethyl ester cyclase